ncbi:MAG: S-layer homology domain-containing protein, partial [Synergistaceae bacterium]|nr:S-layer homology domain-containing protein [Synergistaceae bacterium]
KGFIENGWSTTPYAASDKDYKGTSELVATVTEITTVTTTVLVDENGEPVLDENGEEQLVTTETTTSEVALYPKYVNVTVPSALEPETDENGNYLHKVYIYGYPDSEIKPNNNITREEVTAAFDRLLNAIYRQTIVTTDQNFPDVNDDRWSNESIATMANGGFIVGDENGNFNPSKPITRAEFAVIASKFAPADAKPAENYFTDIDGHWAKDFILKVAGQYWISGYGNGSFNPDAPITRAEAMTIINRMLVRYGDEDSDYAKQWPDVDKSDWYYDSVIEATTHNTYVRTENGWSEKWVNDMISGDEE